MGRTGFSGRRSTVREPRIHGSGAAERASQLSLMPAPAPSRHDCSRRELRPNPIDTRTPLVAPFECLAAGVAVTHIEWARAPSKISSVTPRDPLARGFLVWRALSHPPDEGRLPHPFAKRNAFRRTRGAFLRRTPLAGGAFSTACHQPVEWSPRLFNLHALPRTDGATGVRRLGPFTAGGGFVTLGAGHPFPKE
jgi:hypothetical protein